MSAATDLRMSLAILDESAQAAYRALRAAGLSVDAAKDAVTVHVSDVLVDYVRDQGDAPAAVGDEDDGGVTGP